MLCFPPVMVHVLGDARHAQRRFREAAVTTTLDAIKPCPMNITRTFGAAYFFPSQVFAKEHWVSLASIVLGVVGRERHTCELFGSMLL